MYLHGLQRLRPFKRQAMATCGCMAAPDNVRHRGLGMCQPMLDAGPVCDESAADCGV